MSERERYDDQEEQIEIPDDYIPSAKAKGVMLYWDEENLEALNGIPADDFKQGFIEMLTAAKRYAETFDASEKPNTDQFSNQVTKICIKIVYAGLRRGIDAWRQSSYEKKVAASRKRKGNDPVGDQLFVEVNNWIKKNHESFTASEAISYIKAHENMTWDSALIQFARQKRGLV